MNDPQRHYRRAVMLGVATLAVLTLVASAAFACTVYRGKFTVTGNNGTKVEAVGSGLDMTHCSDPKASGDAEVTPVTGTVILETAAAPCNGDSYQLRGGSYLVSWASEWAIDCMAWVLGFPEYVDPKPLQVDSTTGATTGSVADRTYRVPPLLTQPGKYAAICITAVGGADANRAPVLVV